MPRRLIFAVLLLSMLIQAIALGGRWVGLGGQGATLHALLHWAGLAHHHHQAPTSREDFEGFEAFGDLGAPERVVDDGSGSYHQDQSTDSTTHVVMEACLTGMAMITSWPPGLPAPLPGAALPRARAELAPAAPCLEGLRRPPRSIA